MKQLLLNLYRRLDWIQNHRWFLVSASIAMALLCAGIFGTLLQTSYSLHEQRRTLIVALDGQSHLNYDEHAVSLRERGEVVIDGRVFRLNILAGETERLFDSRGYLISIPIVIEDMLSDQIPRWAPAWLLDQPETTWLLAAVAFIWLQLIIWMRISLPFVLTLIGTLIPVLFLWQFDLYQPMLAVAGMGLLVFTYVLLSRVAMELLSGELVGLLVMGLVIGLLLGVGAGTGIVHGVNWVSGLLGMGEAIPDAVAQIVYMVTAIAGVGVTVMLFLSHDGAKQAFSVAHTVIKEASRSRISLVFIILLLLALPMIPLWLDPEVPLRYRIQTFISRSLSLTFVLAACMTVFLSCATVAFEIRDRQIWHLMTKPLSRFNYLIGKWLGVVSVNLILLLVAGVSIFTFVQYLRATPVAPGMQGQLDALQVETEVLTARVAIIPDYHHLDEEQVRERRQQYIERHPELAILDQVPIDKQREIDEEIQRRHLAGQRSIWPGLGREFLFTGLDRAKEIGAPLTLRYRFWILKSDQHATFPAGIVFNNDERTAREVTYVPSMVHVSTIPSEFIRDDGTLLVTIYNLHEMLPGQQGTGAINFDMNDLELLYKVDNFEINFLRAMLVTWTKLAFLAILGIACATFLSFAVACLLTFTIFLAGSIAPFLAIALLEYHVVPAQHVDWSDVAMVIQWAFTSFIYMIADGLVFLLGAFGEVKPMQDLVEGKFIPWSEVLLGFLRIGMLWSGAALLVGYFVIRSRQLAIYSGQG
jgi:hypothetical protein